MNNNWIIKKSPAVECGILDESLKNKSRIGKIDARLTVSNIIAIIEKKIRIKNCFFC